MTLASELLLSLSLTLAPAEPSGSDLAPTKTLWLVQPLYPGQSLLVKRTEEAIHQMIPPDSSSSEVIGSQELSAALKGKSISLKCLFREVKCADPIDDMVSGLGFKRVVLIKGGQDETGYRFKAASYQTDTGEVANSEGTHAALDRALVAAVIKVVPLSSTLEVSTEPSGATVFIDGEKIGTTPLASGQILPGERSIKIELGSYKTIEERRLVPVHGQVQVQRKLEKLPARVTLNVAPKGSEILIDGNVVGKDHVDAGIMPGKHTFRFQAPGYVAQQIQADIKPNETFADNRTLNIVTDALGEAQENIYKRGASFSANFEYQFPAADTYNVKQFSLSSQAHATRLLSPPRGSAKLMGGSADLTTHFRYFGLMIIGAAYVRSSDPWTSQVTNGTGIPPQTQVVADVDALSLRAFQPQLRVALWRFTFSLQGGAEVRAFRMRDVNNPSFNPNGFLSVDLQIAGQFAIRFHIVEGLFLQAGYRYMYTITGFYGDKGPSMMGYMGGLGYAF